MKEVVLLVTVIFSLLYNVVYQFLPASLKDNNFLNVLASVTVVYIAIVGIYEIVTKYNNRIVAQININGEIIKSKNFPWKVRKISNQNNIHKYIITERYGDSSNVSISIADNSVNKIWLSMDGIAFELANPTVDEFRINIKN